MTTERLRQHLLEEVVIFESAVDGASGAESVSPRQAHRPQPPTGRSALTPETVSLQHRVEQFLFHQAELLDSGCWREYIDLFADEGIYWMPVKPDQTEWLDSPSIFIEDKSMMQIRMDRVMHPNAWSRAAAWGTSHVVGNVVVESQSAERISVRSRFHMLELRRDTLRHFAGTYRHTLVHAGDELRIGLQRVDLLNSQAVFDYVLQVWV